MNKCTYYKSESEKVRKYPNRLCDSCRWYTESPVLESSESTEENGKNQESISKLAIVLEILFYLISYGTGTFIYVYQLKFCFPEGTKLYPIIFFAIFLSTVISGAMYRLDRLQKKVESLEKGKNV